MDRLPRHASARRPLLSALAVSGMIIAAAASGASAAVPRHAIAEQPRISFHGNGPAPLVCSTGPDVTSITIAQGARVVLANFTGSDVTIDSGRGRSIAIEDGKAVSVRLRRGQHELRMIPHCLIVRAAQPASVAVVRASDLAAVSPQPQASQSSLSPPWPSPTGGASAAAQPLPGWTQAPGVPAKSPSVSDSAVPIASGPPSPGHTAAGSTAPPPAAPPGAGADPGSVPPPAADESEGEGPMLYGIEADIYDVIPFPVESPPDPRDGRTLAIIAAICVLGVTGAIIRAILAQRTSSAGNT